MTWRSAPPIDPSSSGRMTWRTRSGSAIGSVRPSDRPRSPRRRPRCGRKGLRETFADPLPHLLVLRVDEKRDEPDREAETKRVCAMLVGHDVDGFRADAERALGH